MEKPGGFLRPFFSSSFFSKTLLLVFMKLICINKCSRYRYSAHVQMRVCPLSRTAEEHEMHFIFVCQSAPNQVRNVCSDLHVGVVSEPTFRSVTEMLLLESCMNLAKYVIEAEKVRKAAQKNSDFI